MKHNAVLIVDDEKNIRMTIGQALESLGIEADTAVNGEEALEKIRKKSFNLILLDLKMPGMDGMDVLRQISQMCCDIKVIVITAYATVDSAVEAMRLGAADFLQKPFSPQDIRESITRVLGVDEKKQGKQR
jgi:DNA-binding NtrC family response regulator